MKIQDVPVLSEGHSSCLVKVPTKLTGSMCGAILPLRARLHFNRSYYTGIDVVCLLKLSNRLRMVDCCNQTVVGGQHVGTSVQEASVYQ